MDFVLRELRVLWQSKQRSYTVTKSAVMDRWRVLVRRASTTSGKAGRITLESRLESGGRVEGWNMGKKTQRQKSTVASWIAKYGKEIGSYNAILIDVCHAEFRFYSVDNRRPSKDSEQECGHDWVCRLGYCNEPLPTGSVHILHWSLLLMFY